jgi:hypothetical protein
VVDVVLHIGAGKCGSSAIQTALTRQPVLRKEDGRRVGYGFIDNSGRLFHGAQLNTVRNARGYHASPSAVRIDAFDDRQFAAIGRQLDKLRVDTLVLSNEDWLRQNRRLKRLLTHIGKTVRVIAYVRPPVSFLNAAWWQWGAWQDVNFDEWLTRKLSDSLWSIPLRAWRKDPHVSDISIRLLPDDVVGDFFTLLGVKLSTATSDNVNRGLPATILRLYQRNKQLRPTRHASEIDFILARRVNYSGSAPWVLERDMVERIVAKTLPSNRELLTMLTPDLAESMRRDPRWWDAGAFADRRVESWEPQLPDIAELERLCVAMAEAIVRMERQSIARKTT